MYFFALRFVTLLLPIFISLVAAANTRERISFQVEKFQLKNGLTVLVHENHNAPIISYQQWFRVGSSFEKPGRTGLAHFFEHLMFKGTKKHSKGEIDILIHKNGGSNNAFTTQDYTGYYTNLPSDKLELIIDIESDRMRNLLFDISEIDSEREVVKEERRMRYDNSVYGSLFELITTTIYKTSSYRWPVIGYMADLNDTKIDELKSFYYSYYAPNNAVVVIAGDVTISQAKKLIEKYYEPIFRQDLPQIKLESETEQKSTRTARLEKDVQSVTLAVVYPGVKVDHSDVYALDLLASAMGSGSSSRLYKRIVYNNELATSVSMSSHNSNLSGELSFYASLKPNVSVHRVLSLLDDELKKIKTILVAEKELEKLKNQVELSYIRGLQTMSSRAQALALNEIIFGDYRKLFEDIDKYEAVTAEDIRRVANTYIIPSKKNIVQIVPKKGSGRQ